MASSSANLWVLLGLGLAGVLLMTRKLKKTIREDFGAFVQRLQLLPPPQPAPPKAPHPLTNLSFAVSDVLHIPLARAVKFVPCGLGRLSVWCDCRFDIEGYVTGFGNPDWARTHDTASRTSPVVSALVEGGATCTGKTVVDEMAYRFVVASLSSLIGLSSMLNDVAYLFLYFPKFQCINGENKHYGTPTNPAAPSRIPGGSSSGAAVAVAANFVDFS
ncbi:Outer envelope protein 64, chloroplastic [Vitis vinifera]|uniref:Outer envelope protein 64, chloroplastic n=1 Tax=Vitis vinifera TaxID=29760 RepID=A0A438CDX4_VITVI|nr:Outer envelope protein 64, chloroplastic [Vitis vinifera]